MLAFRPRQPKAASFASYDVLGVPVSVTTLASASRAIQLWATDRIGRYVCIRDVHGIMRAQESPELKALHKDAAMVAPDGMPLVWLGRRAGHPVERTCGPDLMEKVIADTARSGLRHYLYGGKPGVAQKLKARLEERFPGVSITAAETPPLDALPAEEFLGVAARIVASGADIVWIGLSTPKQEFLMRDLARLVPATLIGVGAAFDFHSGAIRRAPRWMQKSGLEWLYRLISEPKRLWRRYLVMAPRFVWLLLTQRDRADANAGKAGSEEAAQAAGMGGRALPSVPGQVSAARTSV
jgi:N-acetylglucosaminyldiphosphoundecaprenol N-acetyl-beta-D-mannosaminyltransferase